MALLERYIFAKHVPEVLGMSDANMPVWKRLFASLYGGFDEEIPHAPIPRFRLGLDIRSLLAE